MSSSTERKIQRENEKAINRTIEETKDSTRRVVQEAKKELPEFTAAFHDYQEQNIAAIKDIAYNTLEMQKTAAKSGQSMYPNMFANMFWPYGMFPQASVDAYARFASNFAD